MTENLNHRDLEAHLQKLVQAQCSPSKVSVIPMAGSSSISAGINLTDFRIEYKIPEGWNPMQYERIRNFADRLKITDPKRKICSDVAFHEVGHHRLKNDADGLGVPEDVAGKEITLDAVAAVMLQAGRFSRGGAIYLENAISDIINNLNCSQYTKFNGLSMFLAEQGEINEQQFSPLYEAFVKLNQHLWGTPRQKNLVRHYYTDKTEIDDVVNACVREVGLDGDKKQLLSKLFDKTQWKDIFTTFARHLVTLMDQSAPEYLPGSGCGGKGYEVPEKFDPKGKFDSDDCNDPLAKRVLDKGNLKKMMQRRNREGMKVPTFIENWQALDYFYQAEAAEIIIRADAPQKGQRMPIAPIQARSFDPDKDPLESILFGRILLDANGKPCFAVPQSYVEHEARYKKSITSYPDLVIAVLDTSGSMAEAANSKGVGRTNIVPWGDNSKYHYALLTNYGVEKALHKLGVALKMRYNLITFSSTTEATGEKTYDNRAALKRKLFEPSFGGTSLDAAVLAKNASQAGSVLMTISDGEISNWHKVKDTFKNAIADKFYVHFQIGKDTSTTADLESWGAAVVRISDASDLPRRAIDITKKFYTKCAGDVR